MFAVLRQSLGLTNLRSNRLGTGFAFSRLRPKGDKVGTTGGVSSGVVTFMKSFDESTNTVKQGGKRKGANMGVLRVDHPDIMDVITAKGELDKENEEVYEYIINTLDVVDDYEKEKIKQRLLDTQLNNFNISIGITDEFMECLRKGKDFKLINPRNNEIWDIIDPQVIWDKIVHYAHKNGEPGLVFLDDVNEGHPLKEEIESVNVCLTGDTKLLTPNGYKEIQNLVGDKVEIINKDGEVSKSKIWSNGKKETVKMRLSHDEYIKCTPDHKFMAVDGMTYEAQDLKGEQLMPDLAFDADKFNEGFIKYGFIQGDGQTNNLGDKSNVVIVNIGEKDKEIENLFESNDYKWSKNGRKVYVYDILEKLKNIGISEAVLPNREMPKTISKWTKKEKASFLQGCFSANGGVVKGARVSYRTTNKEFAEQLTAILKEDFGLKPYITTSKPRENEFNNGTYTTKESYDINISRYKSLYKFYKKINFYHTYKQIQLKELLKEKAPKVTSINDNGEQEVYDFTEPKTHWGIAEGFVCHNCGEQPLLPYESCVLGAVNLSNMLNKDGIGGYFVDWGKLKTTVQTGVRFLDNVIDINDYPIPKLEESAKENRKIGIGVMGWHEMLIKLNIRYGSEESINYAKNISRFIQANAIQASEELAEEKGVFPNFENSDIEVPRRNAVLTTVAPTGSRSFLANTSGGIEPFFSFKYKHTDGEGNETWFEYDFTEYADDETLVTSMDITPEEHIRMQDAWQKNVGSAVSKTVNLPNEATKEDVDDIYKMAYSTSCKGVTIYRDGSKTSQVLSTDDSEDEEKEESNKLSSSDVNVSVDGDALNEAIQELDNKLDRGEVKEAEDEADSVRFKLNTGCGTLYFIVVFNDDSEIVETFANSSNGGCTIFTQATSRLMSLALRGGVSIDKVVDQLLSAGSCPSYQTARGAGKDVSKGASCAGAIALKLREVKETLDSEEDGTFSSRPTVELNDIEEYKDEDVDVEEEDKSAKCPECGAKIEKSSGCTLCRSCGWSKCG